MGIDPRLVKMFSRGQGKGELKKAEIVQETIRYLAREGVEGLSFEKIGAQLGIGKSHVVYHFRSKDDILLKCFEYIAATAQEVVVSRVLEAESGMKRLQAYISANFEWFESHSDQARVFLYCYLKSSYHNEFTQLNSRIREASIERLVSMVKEVKSGTSAKNVERAHRILDLLTGALVELATLNCFSQRSKIKEKRELVLKALPALLS